MVFHDSLWLQSLINPFSNNSNCARPPFHSQSLSPFHSHFFALVSARSISFQIGTLTILAASKSDSGNYSCSPSNSAPVNVALHVINGKTLTGYKILLFYHVMTSKHSIGNNPRVISYNCNNDMIIIIVSILNHLFTLLLPLYNIWFLSLQSLPSWYDRHYLLDSIQS